MLFGSVIPVILWQCFTDGDRLFYCNVHVSARLLLDQVKIDHGQCCHYSDVLASVMSNGTISANQSNIAVTVYNCAAWWIMKIVTACRDNVTICSFVTVL